MFENSNFRKTVVDGIKNENWLPCRDLVGVSGVKCLGYITGSNKYGSFIALVADNNTNYYIPDWYTERFKAFTDEELAYLMSGEEIKIEKREFTSEKRSGYTFDVYIGKYKM